MTREEAIERIKYCIEKQAWALDENDTEALYEVIPELRESEDERIRKELVAFFKEVRGAYWHDILVSDILAYLEKQKKQENGRLPSPCI